MRIIHGGDTTRLAEAPTGFADCSRAPGSTGPPAIRAGCYAARLTESVRAGEQYRLGVRLPDGGSILGSALVPRPPTLLSPEEGARVEIPTVDPRPGTVRVGWIVPRTARRIEVGLNVDSLYRDAHGVPGSTCRVEVAHPPMEDLIRLDSLTLAVLPPDCRQVTGPVQWDSLAARLLVTAYDSAYARYAEEVLGGGSVRGPRAGAGVVGAFGFFGAAASAERRLILVPTGRR